MHGDWRDRLIDRAWSDHRNSITRLKEKWNDSSAVIVGEWGLSEQLHRQAPGGIAHMAAALGSRAGATLFFTLDAFQEGDHTWGLHDWTNAGPDLALTQPRPTLAAYRDAITNLAT
jgi:hypothetical protein